MAAPRMMRTGRHRRGRSLAPSSGAGTAANAQANDDGGAPSSSPTVADANVRGVVAEVSSAPTLPESAPRSAAASLSSSPSTELESVEQLARAPIPRLAPLAVFEPERASGGNAGDWGTREWGARERAREADPRASGARRRSLEEPREHVPEDPADDAYDPLARSRALRVAVMRLGIGVLVATLLLAAFAVARALSNDDARAPASSTSSPAEGQTAVPGAPALPAEKRATPAVRADDAASSEVEVEVDPEIDVARARAERWEVQAALELRDIRRAIDVGERAVRHDPSEADGWLLLAAAQMDIHDEHAANRALAACAKRATHGPRGECIALLPPEIAEP